MYWLLTLSMTFRSTESKKSLSVTYTQIFFAMVADMLVWDVVPNVWNIVGRMLILCSSAFVALAKGDEGYTRVSAGESMEKDSESNLQSYRKAITGGI